MTDRGENAAMWFDTTLAVLLDESRATWQKANATAFLVSGARLRPHP